MTETVKMREPVLLYRHVGVLISKDPNCRPSMFSATAAPALMSVKDKELRPPLKQINTCESVHAGALACVCALSSFRSLVLCVSRSKQVGIPVRITSETCRVQKLTLFLWFI